MSTATVERQIDPSVDLCGLPAELVESARWVELTEEVYLAGEKIIRRKKVPEINGIAIHADTPLEDYKRFIKMFPLEPVMLPMDQSDREQYRKTGKRPAERLTFNGVVFTIPKGVVVQVYQPLAAMVRHMNEPLVTERAREMAADPNSAILPLGADVPFDL